MDLESIYLNYFDDVYKYLVSINVDSNLAEEITQQTMFIAINKIDSFKNDSKLSVWLISIAKNLYYKEYNNQKRFVTNTILDSIEQTNSNIDNDLKKQIYKALHDLEEPYKEIFTLRTLSDLSFKEISQLFNKNESWARVIYYRARLKLMEVLKNEI